MWTFIHDMLLIVFHSFFIIVHCCGQLSTVVHNCPLLSTVDNYEERMKHYYIIYIYSSKPLDAVQSMYFGSKLPKHGDCTTSNGFELFLMCCGVMLHLLIMHMYI